MKQSTLVALALALMLIIAFGLILKFKNTWVASRIAGLATTNLLADAGYEMSLEGIAWWPGEGITLREPRIHYGGEHREPFDLFEAKSMSMQLRLRSLLKGNLESRSVTLDDAVIRAFPVEAEGWGYPGLDEEGGEPSEARVVLESVQVSNFLLLRPGDEGMDSLSIRAAQLAFLRDSKGMQVGIDSLAGRLPSGLNVLALRGDLNLHDQKLKLQALSLKLPGSECMVEGELLLGAGPMLDLSGNADSLRLDEVAALLGQNLETDSSLDGRFHISGHPDSLHLAGKVSGNLYDFLLDDIELSGFYGGQGQLSFRDAKGRVNHNEVEGRAEFSLPHDDLPLSLDIQGKVSHFDLGKFLGDGPPSDLNGQGSVSGGENDLALHFELGPGEFMDLPFGACVADIELLGDSLSLRRIAAVDEGLDIELSGWLKPDEETLLISATGRSRSSELARYFSADSTLTGDLDFTLKISGPIEGPALELQGPFWDAVYMGAHVDSGRVEIFTEALELEPLDLILEANHVNYWKFDFNKGFLRARVYPDSLELAYASLEGDPLSVTLAGYIPLNTLPPSVSFERFWIHYQEEDWLNDRPFTLYLGDAPRVDAVEFLSGSGRLGLEWKRHHGGISVVDWNELNFSMFRQWLPPFLADMGKSRGRLLLDSNDHLDLRMDLEDLRLQGRDDGSNQVRASWEGDSLNLAVLHWRLPDDSFIKANGWMEGLPAPGDLLDGMDEIQKESLTLDLNMDFEAFPLERLMTFYPDSLDLAGRITGKLHLHGPQDLLSLESSAELDSFRAGPAALDKIRWTASSQGRTLNFHRLEARVGSGEGSVLEAQLSLPLELSLFAPPKQDPDGKLGGEFDFVGRLEDFQPFLSRWLAEAQGDLEARIALAGTARQPEPRGRIELKRGKLRPMAWEEEFVDLHAEGRVEGDTLFLENAESREGLRFERGRNGQVSAQGWLTWRGPLRYGASATVSNFSLSTLPIFTGVLSGDLTLSTFQEVGVREHPFLEGNFVVSRGELHDLLEQSVAAADEPAPLSYRLDLSSAGGLYLRDAEADLELAGDITVTSLPSGQDISGILDIRRGRYTLFWHVFHLKEGTLDFNRAKGFNPELFIVAETETRDDKITLEITGTLEEPNVGVESSLGYNEEDVLRILIGAPQSGQGWSESTTEAVGGTVSNQLVGRLESWASGELFSGIFDTVEIEGNPLSAQETRWQVGRYLPGGFYVTYNHGLSLDSTWELGMENRLLDWMILRMELINRGEELGAETLPNEYNFDIRFRYEY
jgi:autotransporter translocation and assembly factor TamB